VMRVNYDIDLDRLCGHSPT
jgi:hypothetical protein